MFKSQAQRRKFASLLTQGKISQKTFDEWTANTPEHEHLPERIGVKPIQKVRPVGALHPLHPLSGIRPLPSTDPKPRRKKR